MDLPDLIHHFSWATKVSLELPIGFEEESEDASANVAIYADDLDEDDPPGARVMTKATAVPGQGDEAWQALADQIAALPGRTVASRSETRIDGLPAAQLVVRYHDDSADMDVVRHETVAQAGDVLFTITGLVPAELADQYLPAFERASATARMVLL